METSKKQQKNLNNNKMDNKKIYEILNDKGWNYDVLRLNRMLDDINDVCKIAQKELLEELFHNYSLDSRDDFLNEIRKKINKLSRE